jgi:hypothetical protein
MIPKNNVLLYTFRTNPFKEDLKERFPGLFVFGKLNEDFDDFRKRIYKERPKLIIGCAKSDRSCFEMKSINRFNDGTIIKNGKVSFGLFVPSIDAFDASLKPTTSFCNWTMYKISDMISKDKLDSKLSFIHFRDEDYPKLVKSIELLR